MWHQEGEIPSAREGLSMLVMDTPGESARTPAEAVVEFMSTYITVGTGVSLVTPAGFVEKYFHTAANPPPETDAGG